MKPKKPPSLRVIVFVDGQNFYHDCCRIFGHGNTHPHLLGRELCGEKFGVDRQLKQVRFYTGFHISERKPQMNASMMRRLEIMRANGVWTFSRSLKYSKQWVKNNDNEGPEFVEIDKGREKGVDVRIALDLVMLAIINEYDLGILVSTDTDLDEAVREVLLLRSPLKRWLAIENAVCVPESDPITGVRPPYKRLRAASRLLHIDKELFLRIKDTTNYNLD